MLRASIAIGIFLIDSLLAIPGSAAPADAASTPQQALLKQYGRLEESLRSNQYHAPIDISSDYHENAATGEVYALLSHEFKQVSDNLNSASNWCQVMLLHVNVKGCESHINPGTNSNIILYVGREYYQPPEDAYSIQYTFRVTHQLADFFAITMSADDGPFGTSNYVLIFEAIPKGANATFIHLKYSYQYGVMATLMLKGYLATLGRKKVGFTIKQYDQEQHPVYVRGIQGIVERNSMRYFLAIQAFLDTVQDDRSDWQARMNRWYQLSEPFKTQLIEYDDKKYIEYKQPQFRAGGAKQNMP